MSKQKIILIGGGGHCKSCIEVIESCEGLEIIGILDVPAKIGTTVLNYPVIGTNGDIEKLGMEGHSFLVTIGHILDNSLRKGLYNRLYKAGFLMPCIHAKNSSISKYATTGSGSIIMNYACVNAAATVGRNVIINTRANIEHDAIIGDHCHISTGATINGGCVIEDDVFIGSGAVIGNGIKVTSGSIIGMGSVVNKSIDKKGIYYGNPAVFVREL